MKKIMSLFILLFAMMLVGCSNNRQTTSESDLETMKLNKIQEAIYMVDYPAKQGEIITNDLALPTSYKDVKISWETIYNPEIISSTGKVSRPNTCWIDSRDQQGVVKFEELNNNWPVILLGTFEYEGLKDTHKLLVVVKPQDNFTCDKYLGN